MRPGAGGVVPRPSLWQWLGGPERRTARVTVVSAPPGSGKTVLLRSWITEAGLAGRVAWVTVGRDERDPQRFWLSVLDALRQTSAGSALVRALTAAPDLDGWTIVERLLEDLAPLPERLWLVIDDLHELGSTTARRQLELLLMRAPQELRFVLATRHDVRLGLHRLRLEGELTEIRVDDLRFTADEARALFAAAGVELPGPALEILCERTEGWAAGLRLAALSLAGHPDPGRFAAEFSGSERTVAEYLLAEVLDRQPAEVRRLLLRTSVLDRVNGELADLLTGTSGGERMLQELEEANAFVVSLDATRTWFRYHHLFAELLQLELRRTRPAEVAALHELAAGWLAGHGHPVEAIRHAQAARDWPLAARLLADHWPGLYLDGQAATLHVLLARFPGPARATYPEVAALAAADELARGSLEAAERYLALAERGPAPEAPDNSAPAAEGVRSRLEVLLGAVRLLVARHRADPSAVAEQAQRLQVLAEAPELAQDDLAPAAGVRLGAELRALALVSLGVAEFWAARREEAQRHLEQGVAVAHRIGRPYLEFIGLASQAMVEVPRSFTRAGERGRHAVEVARRHGWTDEPAVGGAYTAIAAGLAWQGRPEEAEPWVQRAERTTRAEAEPAEALVVCHLRGVLELARGRYEQAVTAFRAAERLSGQLAAPHLLVPSARAYLLHAITRLGETERAERILAAWDQDCGEMRAAAASLWLARDDPVAASAALAPVLDGSVPVSWPTWLVHAFMLEAIARDATGDATAAGRALERALDLAEPDGGLLTFLMHPAPRLLERHAKQRTAHAALIAEILDVLVGSEAPGASAPPRGITEPLSDREVRVLRYLPTNLSAPEIATELSVSPNTVKTHMRNLYGKLGTHRRAEAVERARALGLLAPSPPRR